MGYKSIAEDWYWYPRKDNSQGYFVIAGTWAIEAQAGDNLREHLRGSATLNDEIVIPMNVKSVGTRTLNLLWQKDSDMGIATVSVNGTSLGTVDLYSASTAFNQVTSIDFTATRAGVHSIAIKMTSKHASSTAYRCRIQGAWLS